ncbi:hypothetical protein H5410_008640 [Solanum commersonii]|uniref:Uncharacterized protein n=1 Tax=Solanum commersonii TaxID=4109 RepID=A0A9J6AFI3_SOLCO|nr:hypothetical protein H5410_008640 [Solanum commersonii]
MLHNLVYTHEEKASETEVDLLGYTSVTQGKWFTNSTPGYYRNTDSINNSNVTTPIEITKEHADEVLLMCLAMVCCSSSFLAPTTLSTIFPSLMNMKVGIASTAQSVATDCDNQLNVWLNNFTFNSSTSTFRKVTVGIFLANSARNGAMNLQGPHQEAVKSTTICNIIHETRHDQSIHEYEEGYDA